MIKRHKALNLLHPDFQPRAERLLARCVEAGIMIMIVETWRSQAAHEEDVKNGRSWVKKSKHQNTITKIIPTVLMKTLKIDNCFIPASLAIDIAPYSQYQLHGSDKLQWDGDDPVWQKLGKIGKSLGLRWGGRWQTADMAHFEM